MSNRQVRANNKKSLEDERRILAAMEKRGQLTVANSQFSSESNSDSVVINEEK
jgi:hypothetical protein